MNCKRIVTCIIHAKHPQRSVVSSSLDKFCGNRRNDLCNLHAEVHLPLIRVKGIWKVHSFLTHFWSFSQWWITQWLVPWSAIDREAWRQGTRWDLRQLQGWFSHAPNVGDVHTSPQAQDAQAHYRSKRICIERENLEWDSGKALQCVCTFTSPASNDSYFFYHHEVGLRFCFFFGVVMEVIYCEENACTSNDTASSHVECGRIRACGVRYVTWERQCQFY